MSEAQDVREQVREVYAGAARVAAAGGGSCCGDGPIGAGLYEKAEREEIPEAAARASLGCGNPTAVADLREGEVVLDLGSGGGIDALLAAKRVGPSGKVYGLDMTEEMLALAVRNKEEAGARNVEFLKGYIEDVPLPAGTVDVIVSNCVVNLSADKARVFREAHRVLKPGGRLAITDIVASDDLTPEQRAERGTYAECIAGALSFAEYARGLAEAGFAEVGLTPTHEVLPGMQSVIIRATKPAGTASVAPTASAAATASVAPAVPAAACRSCC